MSKLLEMMKAKKAATQQKKVIEKSTPKVLSDPAKPPELEPIEPELKPTSFSLAKPTTTNGLNEIATSLSKTLTEAEQKVADQQEAGVYDLAPEATELLGSEADQLVQTMQALDAALVEKTPEIRTLSRDIRKNLEQYPELTHILTDAQLHIMVQGYLTIAGVKTAPKTKAAKTAQANKKADATIKSLASKSMDDLF